MPRLNCRQNTDCKVHAAQYVANCRANTGRAISGMSGNRHQTAHCLGNNIVPRALGIAAITAESGNCRIDQSGIQLFQFVVSQSQFIHNAGAVVFQYDVGFCSQFAENFFSFLALEVQSNAAFIAVEVAVIEAFTVDIRAVCTGIVAAAGKFDFDNICTKVSQHRAAVRACNNTGQVEDGDIFKSEMFGHGKIPPFL